MSKNIGENGKCVLGGSKNDTIALLVSFSNIPKSLNVEGCSLLVRSTFHVTLVAIGKIIERNQITDPDFLNKVVADFRDFSQKNEIDILRFRDEFRFAWEDDLRSVVVMCDVSNINEFYNLINGKYGLQLEYPPTHVTLYTLQQDKGIYLTNSEDIKTMTKLIANPGIELEWGGF